MKAPADKSLAYTAVAVVLGILISLVVGAVVAPIAAMGALAGGATGAPGQLSGTVHVGNGSINLGQLQQSVQQMQQQAQAVQNGGGAAGGQIVAVDPAKLKALLPDTLNGLPRTELNSTSAGNQAVSSIEATYANTSGESVKVEITDIGVASPLAGFATAMNVQKDDETANGYDREQTINGRMTIQKYDTPSKSGEYSVLVANRFNIDATGSGVTMDVLQAAVNAVGPDRLDALAKGG